MTEARDFYATLAQVLPVLLLTIVWDREWLARLATRVRRTPATAGVRFWTKPVVRWYSISLAVVLTAAIGTCVLVLAGVLDDASCLRGLLVGATAMALVTLVVRLTAGIIEATQ